MNASDKGIASNPVLHKFASAKGGSVKVSKGIGKLPPERRREIAANGGRKKYENRRNNSSKPKEISTSIADIGLERIHSLLNEQV